MLSKPFAISGISDPSQLRVVFYTGQHFVHAPLSELLELLRVSLRLEFEGSIQSLEERIGVLRSELEELKECLF